MVEAVFYDREAFARPFRIVTPWTRTGGIESPERRYNFVECRVENGIVLGPDGRPSQLTPFDEGYIDFLGRPWAQNWEKFFEQGWERSVAARAEPQLIPGGSNATNETTRCRASSDWSVRWRYRASAIDRRRAPSRHSRR